MSNRKSRDNEGRRGQKWRAVRELVLKRDGGVCWVCGHAGAGEVDHVIPRSTFMRHGGHAEDASNLKAAHGTSAPCPVCRRKCNQERNRRNGRAATYARPAVAVVASGSVRCEFHQRDCPVRAHSRDW